jgi:hypothetical protein
MAKTVVAASGELFWVLELPDGMCWDTRPAPPGVPLEFSSQCPCAAVCPLLAHEVGSIAGEEA